MISPLPAEYASISSTGTLADKARLWMDIVHRAEPAADIESLRETYLHLFRDEELPIAWLPDEKIIKETNLTALMKAAKVNTYDALHRWSTANRSQFWETVIRQLEIVFHKPYDTIFDPTRGVEDPAWLSGAELNITDSCFLGDPMQTALIAGAEGASELRRISYGELKRSVNRTAAALLDLGFAPGDRIAIYAPLAAEIIIAYLAIIRAGMVAVSVPDSYSSLELNKRMEVANATGVITCNGYTYNGKYIRILDKAREATTARTIICCFGEKPDKRENEIWWEDLNSSSAETFHRGQSFHKRENFNNSEENRSRENLNDGDDFQAVTCKPDDPINILFSSGTTKEPKAIAFTQLTPIKCASDGCFHLDIKATDTVSWTTGMGWMMAPWLIYASLINKATLAIYTGAASGTEFGNFVEQSGITILGTVPSIVRAWRTHAFEHKFNWKIRVYSSTGEPSNADDYFYLMALTGFRAPVIEYCGGTEIGGAYITGTVVQPVSPATFTTPTLGLDFYLLDETHRPVGKGQAGEVFLIPPSIGMSQRLLNADHHREYYAGVPTGPKGETLRRHGDAFEMIEALGTTFYRSVGRTDDAMNLGGVKVSALEIETVINKHPAITESAAFSVLEGAQKNERLVVYYTAPTPAENEEMLKKELQQLISKDLTPLFKISELVYIDTLTRTASNKLMRRALKSSFMAKK